jgi:hypothetical protein
MVLFSMNTGIGLTFSAGKNLFTKRIKVLPDPTTRAKIKKTVVIPITIKVIAVLSEEGI